MLSCEINPKALLDGTPSLLFEELKSLYAAKEPEEAAAAAYEQLLKIRKAQAAGRFASRTPRANGEPTLAQVQELLKNGSLDPPTAAMVAVDKLAEITAHIARVKPLLQSRLDGYERGDPGLNPKDKSVKDLRQVIAGLENKDQLQAYVDLVQYADRTLRDAKEFLAGKFDAQAAADSNGANDHPAALAEIAGQMNTFSGVLAPKLARENSTLRNLLTGRDGVTGLNDLRDEVQALVTERTVEYIREVVKKNANREGLSDEQVEARIKGTTDVTWITKAFGGASGSSDKLIAALFTVVADARLRAEAGTKLFNEQVLEKAAALVKATGSNDFSYMVQLDKAGKTTMRYIQRIGKGYSELRQRLLDALEKAGKYIEGNNLTQEERAHNIGVWQAKQGLRVFNQAEIIDEQGNATDGEHHRYTEEFKRIREGYQELRQDGQYWRWGRRAGTLGFATQAEADEQYARFEAKYYTEERDVPTMLKAPDGTPTGVLGTRRMRFTKSNAQEVVEERHRDKQYQKLLDDQSVAGKARLDWYNFFIGNLHAFANQLPEADRQHLLNGELPAIRALVAGRYNSQGKGFLDWAGRLVKDPLGTMKELLPAVKAGRDSVRLNEDGTLEMDVLKKFTGRFKNQDKITKWKQELEELQKQPATKEGDLRIKKLKTALVVENNRLESAEGEMDLPQLLMSFGAMADNYQALKEQEGTVKLLQHAVNHREYYEENKDGSVKVYPEGHEKEGQPIPKANYSSQASRLVADWLKQNFYEDSERMDEGAVADLAGVFQRVSSMTIQGLNLPAALKNFAVGTLNNRVVAAAGKFGLSKKAMTHAVGLINKDTYNIVADRMGDAFDRSTYIMRPKTSLVDAIVTEFNFLQHGNGVDDVKSGGKSDLLYLGVSMGEYHIQSQIALAKMSTAVVTGLDGKQADVLSCYSLANGKLRVDPNCAEAIAKLRNRLVLDVRAINKHVSGNYAEDDKAALQRNWLGRLAMQYHKWIYEGFKARWGREQYNEGLGENTKGYYRSLEKLFKAMDGLLLRKEAWDQLSELEKANLKAVAKEVEYIAGILALLLLAGALKPDPDDEDKKWLYLTTNFAERVLGGTRQELTGYANPLDIYSNVKNPIAGLSYVKDIAVFTQRMLEVPIYGLTGQSDQLVYQSGYLKGESKALKSGLDLVPGIRVPKRVWEQIHTTGVPFIK